MIHPSLPSSKLLGTQAEWLQPARSRLLRRIGIAHKQRVLDLGAGYGQVTQELARRSQGYTMALDRHYQSLREIYEGDNIFRVGGIAPFLPIKDTTFDLVFCQCALLWMSPINAILGEIWRVLSPNGHLIAIEPDYGGLIEWPDRIATRHLWINVLNKCGADPEIGRKLPTLLKKIGFEVTILLIDRLVQPSTLRFEFLKDLPLTRAETSELNDIKAKAREIAAEYQIAHLPYFLIIASKPRPSISSP